jgi:hypothetical protein
LEIKGRFGLIPVRSLTAFSSFTDFFGYILVTSGDRQCQEKSAPQNAA